MKIYLLLCLQFLFIAGAYALKNDSTNAELITLMQERKTLATDYYSSLEKKSGFFGNRTKNDLRDSQEKLVEIVRVDNKIMDVLNRTINFRNFEKSNMVYDKNNSEDRIRNLTILNDTLNKQVEVYSGENKMYRSDIRRHHIYFVGLILLLILAAWKIFRKNISG